jgi:ribosomal protein L30E
MCVRQLLTDIALTLTLLMRTGTASILGVLQTINCIDRHKQASIVVDRLEPIKHRTATTLEMDRCQQTSASTMCQQHQ